MLKLKDFPPRDDFAEVLPRHNIVRCPAIVTPSLPSRSSDPTMLTGGLPALPGWMLPRRVRTPKWCQSWSHSPVTTRSVQLVTSIGVVVR